jgi:chemotaxis protein MotA
MDSATVIGLVSAIAITIISIMMGGPAYIFWNAPSFVLVIGGTIASTLINYPLSDLLSVMGTVRNAFFHKAILPEQLIEKLVSFASIARREGILALEGHATQAGDVFLQRSVQLAVDGTAPELIKDVLTTELAFTEDRHSLGQAILTTMGGFAPAYGMIGTLIGLVQMLTTMNDPSQIGAGMAVAILTTLYGALIANLFCLPAAGKLKVRTSNELLIKQIVIEGILSIQSGDNPRVVEQKLKAFVSPSVRDQIQVKR